MTSEIKLIRIRDILTESERSSLYSLYKRNGLKITKKIFTIKRCDTREISKSCSCISLEDIDDILKTTETKFQQTKNMNTKLSIIFIKNIRKKVESFLNTNNQKGKQ